MDNGHFIETPNETQSTFYGIRYLKKIEAIPIGSMINSFPKKEKYLRLNIGGLKRAVLIYCKKKLRKNDKTLCMSHKV